MPWQAAIGLTSHCQYALAHMDGKITSSKETTTAEPVVDDAGGLWPWFSEQLPGWAQPIWQTLEAHPWLFTLVLIISGWLLAKLSQLVFRIVLSRLTARTKTEFDDRLISLLSKPVFTTVLLIFLIAITVVLDFGDGATRIVVNVLKTLILFSWTFAGLKVARLALEILSHVHDRFELIQPRTIPLFDITLKIVLVGASIYIFFMIWGIDPTAWLASAGIIGIAVGFAAKDTLANLFSGIFIVADAPYKLGDYVVLDSGERGVVRHVGMRSTRLLTRDDIEVTIPNAVIGNSKIVNESGGPWEKERIRIKAVIDYGCDIDQVTEVLLQIAAGHEHIVREPTPRVRLRELGDFGLHFELLCWIDEPVLRGRLSHELTCEVYNRFRAEGLSFAYPKQEVVLSDNRQG